MDEDDQLSYEHVHGAARVRLPSDFVSPARQLLWRLAVGLALIALVTTIAYVDRDGYNDTSDGHVNLLDALYYSTVSISTTGYGDITPVSDRARILTTFVVTPARIAFLILLVGTSIELITVATRRRLRRRTWRKKVNQHIIICGYGVKGRSALESLGQQHIDTGQVVVIDNDPELAETAARAGFVAVIGDMTRNTVLVEAGIKRAHSVIVAPNRDDTTVLTVLTARSLNADVKIVAAAREIENSPLLRHSGADVVLASSGATGRMMGLASSSPHAVMFIEDLLEVGEGFDVIESEVQAGANGPLRDVVKVSGLVLSVYRDGTLIARAPRGDTVVQAGDRLVILVSDDKST